jgi:hypothetical protein
VNSPFTCRSSGSSLRTFGDYNEITRLREELNDLKLLTETVFKELLVVKMEQRSMVRTLAASDKNGNCVVNQGEACTSICDQDSFDSSFTLQDGAQETGNDKAKNKSLTAGNTASADSRDVCVLVATYTWPELDLFSELTYHELHSARRLNGLPANGKTHELLERLTSALA